MSAAETVGTAVALALVELGVDAARGRLTPSEAARRLVGVGLDMVPRSELIAYLTPTGVAAAELLADVAEAAKFSRLGDDEP